MRFETEYSYGGCQITIKKLGTKEDEERRYAEQKKKDLTDIKEAVGLSILMKKIVNSVCCINYVSFIVSLDYNL